MFFFGLFILQFILTRSVRIDEFHWDLALEEGCQTTCAKPKGTVHGKGTRQGLYHLHGEAARDVSLYPHRHVFIALDSTCQHEGPPVTLVPWVDAEDPVNNSQWEIYVDPTLEMQLRFGARSNAYLCSQATPDKARCVCKLGGFETTEWQMLGHLAMWMPDPIAGRLLDVHLSLDRRCPDMRIPDICICSLLVLTMLSALLCLEAARALRSKSKGPEESWSTDPAVEIATPFQTFSSGLG